MFTPRHHHHPRTRFARLLVLWSFIMLSLSAAKAHAQLEWTSATLAPIEIDGLPYREQNHDKWWRFPESASHAIPDYVWSTSRASSGARVRLRTDATQLWIRGTIERGVITDNISRFGQGSFDLYIDGEYSRSVVPQEDGSFETVLLDNVPAVAREICIYAPLFAESQILAVGLNPGASLAAPAPFVLPKPLVFYGTSITHGGCAARSGLTYPAQTARKLSLDFVNFGLNGCGRGEAAVGKILAGVDAAAYVLHFSQNNESTAAFEANYDPFIAELRAQHPTTPIVCVTPIYWTNERPGVGNSNVFEANREVVRRVVAARRAAGDLNIHLVEGFDLLGPQQADGLIDGLHPNTLGYFWMAEALAPRLKTILNLKP